MNARLLSCFVISAGVHSLLAWQLRPEVQPPVLPLARGVVCVSLRSSPGIVHGSENGEDDLKPADERISLAATNPLPRSDSVEQPPRRLRISTEPPMPILRPRELLAHVAMRVEPIPLPEPMSPPMPPHPPDEIPSDSAIRDLIDSLAAADSDGTGPDKSNAEASAAETRRGSPLPDSTPSAAMRQGVPSGAHLVGTQKPEYPREAWERGLEGRVVVWMHVAADGHVDQAKIVESSGHRILDDNSLRFALSLRFVPARLGDTPVPAEVELPVRYHLVGSR